VTFGNDRAGLVGEDGPTHAGAYDYAYMRTGPNMVIMAPKDENECRQMLHTASAYNGPAAVRDPRGAGVGVEIQQELTAIELGKAE
ncbi:1-deoxy-D-xylulose-5-phosphate synthase, partial [Acinetobacter pittii]